MSELQVFYLDRVGFNDLVSLKMMAKLSIGASLQEHKNCGEMTEIEAKVKYVKLARSLRTYGVSFFLVKVGNPTQSRPGCDKGNPPSLHSMAQNKGTSQLCQAEGNG